MLNYLLSPPPPEKRKNLIKCVLFSFISLMVFPIISLSGTVSCISNTKVQSCYPIIVAPSASYEFCAGSFPTHFPMCPDCNYNTETETLTCNCYRYNTLINCQYSSGQSSTESISKKCNQPYMKNFQFTEIHSYN